MKKIFTLFTTLIFASAVVFSTQAKAQTCSWAKKAGSNLEDLATSIATDSYGNVYTVGEFFSQTMVVGTTTLHNLAYSNGEATGFIVKYDDCGNFKWVKQFGGNDLMRAKGVATDASGNVFVAGYFSSDTLHFGTSSIKLINTSSTSAFVAKYDSTGTVIWAQQGSGNAQNEIYNVATDGTGNVYVTGAFASDVLTIGTYTLSNHDTNNYDDVFTAKLDNNGNVQWLQGGKGAYEDEAYGVSTDAAGNVYIAGTYGSSSITFGTFTAPLSTNGFYDVFVVKYNSSGIVQWLKTAGGNSQDNEALGIATDASGNSYVTGYIGSTYSDPNNPPPVPPVAFGSYNLYNNSLWNTMFIAKYDASGTVQWAHASISADFYTRGDYAHSIKLDAAGNAYIIGSFSSDSLNLGAVTIYNNSLAGGGGDTITDVFVAKYKANGILSWARSAGGANNEFGFGIAVDANNSVYICGEYDSPSVTFGGITLTSTNTNGDAFIANNISTLSTIPDICLVSADSSLGKDNFIYWDKTAYPTASSFNFYRETSTGVYKKIGSQTYAALSQFVDTARSVGPANGDPTIGSYKYTMQIVDTSGNTSLMSPYHKTVYFQHSIGSGTFNWNIYEVGSSTNTPVGNYYLMRDDNSTNVWNSIGSVTGTGVTLNDPNFGAFQNTASWRVDADGFNCTPTLRLASGNNSADAAKIKSHSNQTNNRTIGIEKITNNQQVSIYPNPANTNFVVETTSTEKQQLQIVDVTGKIVFSQTITGKTTIDASLLNAGVYNITIIGNGSVANKKLVIVK